MLLDEHGADLLEERVHRFQQDQLLLKPLALAHMAVGLLEVGPRGRDRIGHVGVHLLHLNVSPHTHDQLVGHVAGEGGQYGEHAEAQLALHDLLVQQQLVVQEGQRHGAAPLLDVAHAVPGLLGIEKKKSNLEMETGEMAEDALVAEAQLVVHLVEEVLLTTINMKTRRYPTKAKGMLIPFSAIQSISRSQRFQSQCA